MRRQLIVSLVLITVLLALGGGIAAMLVITRPAAPTADLQRPPLVVMGVKLTPQTVVLPVIGYGTARADRAAWLSPQVPGEVIELAAGLRVGVPVVVNQLLVRLDDREYSEQLRRAQSLLDVELAQLAALDIEQRNLSRLITIAQSEHDIAQREYERILGLLEQQAAGRRELDLARAALEQARRTLQTLENQLALLPQQRAQREATCQLRRAEVALTELNVERCTIRAPFDGELSVVDVEIGERVAVGQRLLTLLDPRLIELPIELPVSRRGHVRVGTACRLMLESRDDVVWSGTVARIAPNASETTRTFALFVDIDNAQQEQPLLPGMFVQARIDGPTLREALLVPRGSAPGNRVFIAVAGEVRQRAVQVVGYLEEQTIIAGVEPGVVVITSNLDALHDGAAVQVRLTNEGPNQPAAVSPAARPALGRTP
ncbi:MAG: efflux RND transporter periplasmic adaptor subunit [Planctomycetes bacterium]|nr:efflux RND transporter periplasmic adaptor subunit [Planctomycetota bacterium]